MLRRLAILCVLWLVSLAPRALACQCIGSLQPCNQTAASDVVFIGTVESMEPKPAAALRISPSSA
jgi:hypothetical protein